MRNVIHQTRELAGITRQRLATARLCCERHIIARTGFRKPPRSRILCYHAVGTGAWSVNDIDPARFRRQLELALERGYRFVPADLIAEDGDGDKRLAITFDDGLTSVARNAAPILAELGIPWTVFVVSDWADGRWGQPHAMDWGEIDRVANQGAAIGSHSKSHPNFARISHEQAEEEIFRSRDIIAARIGITPTAFAIPFGRSKGWTPEAHDAARRAGYRHVYAQAEETRPPGTIPRTFITRFDNDGIFRAALGGAFDRWESRL